MMSWTWFLVAFLAGYLLCRWQEGRVLPVAFARLRAADEIRRDERVATWKRAAAIVGRFAEECEIAVVTTPRLQDLRVQAAHQHADNAACLLSCSLYGELLAELEQEYQEADT